MSSGIGARCLGSSKAMAGRIVTVTLDGRVAVSAASAAAVLADVHGQACVRLDDNSVVGVGWGGTVLALRVSAVPC